MHVRDGGRVRSERLSIHPRFTMRFVPILALAAHLASPALAQTQYADSSGGFVSLNALTFSSSGIQAIDGTLGYRFSNGADLGLRYGTTDYGADASFHRFGPVVGITRPLGSGFSGRAEATVQFSTFSARRSVGFDGHAIEPFNIRSRGLFESVSTTVSRRVPLVGSLALRPAIGGYAAARQRLMLEYPGLPYELARTAVSAGLQVEIPLTFRLFGQDAAVVPGGRLPLVSTRGAFGLSDATYLSGGLRLNF